MRAWSRDTEEEQSQLPKGKYRVGGVVEDGELAARNKYWNDLLRRHYLRDTIFPPLFGRGERRKTHGITKQRIMF